MRGLNEIQKVTLGDSQGTPSEYFKKSQASKLGDAMHFTSLNQQLSVSLMLSLNFLFVHMMCPILGVLFFLLLDV